MNLSTKLKIIFLPFLLVLCMDFSYAQTKITVAADGSGDYLTVQQAINAVTDNNPNRTIIYIRNGVYKEKLRLAETKINVSFIGENADKTILTYDDYASKPDSSGKNIGTSGSSSFFVMGDNFSAENITFQNSAGPRGQAVAVRVAGDKARFIHCRFLGFQDTLYTYGPNSRQYYYDCYIEGTVDFIFGSSTAIFDSCTIFGKISGFYTAASTPRENKYGYVFLHCKITGNAPAQAFFLGRPWRPYAKTVFIRCNLDSQVSPEGWNNWGNTANESTAFYAEYQSEGAGAVLAGRSAWSHQLTADEANTYSIETILAGWNPRPEK